MIVLREKQVEFSSNAQLKTPKDVALGQGKGILIELVKSIEFYNRQANLKHWLLEEIVGRYFGETMRSGHIFTDCLVQFEDNIRSNRSAIRRFGSGLPTPSGKKFVRDVLNEFTPGKYQYNKYKREYQKELDDLVVDDDKVDFYQKVMKYIALSLTGQIIPKDTSLWEVPDNIQVNYEADEEPTNQDLDLAKKIILDCIVGITYEEGSEIKRLRG